VTKSTKTKHKETMHITKVQLSGLIAGSYPICVSQRSPCNILSSQQCKEMSRHTFGEVANAVVAYMQISRTRGLIIFFY